MNLTMIELRRIFRSRMVLAAVVFLLVMDVFVYGNTGNSYYTVFGKDSKAHIAEAQEDGAYFKGEVTDQWIAWVTGEADAIRNNPANQLQGDEREAMKQKLADQGFDYATVEEKYPGAFIKEEVLNSRSYTRYEPAEVAANFSENARKVMDLHVSAIREGGSGHKAKELERAAKEACQTLAENYTPIYDYNLGYGWMNNIMLCQHFILGILLAVGLSGIISDEYLKKMDAMIQVTTYGRRKTALAKLKAGLLFSILVWVLFMGLNLLLTTVIYGWEGWESYWQDGIFITAPFPWGQGKAMLVGMGTSLLGALYFASFVMMVSSLCKTPAASMLLSFGFLMIPAVCEQYGYMKGTAYFPASLMRGEYIWQSYRPVYMAGVVLNEQILILMMGLVVSAVCMLFTVRNFERHQVSNSYCEILHVIDVIKW